MKARSVEDRLRARAEAAGYRLLKLSGGRDAEEHFRLLDRHGEVLVGNGLAEEIAVWLNEAAA